MNSTFDSVLQSAKALTEDERFHLIDALMAEVDDEDFPLNDQWREEIERRSREIDLGLVKPVSWEEVKQRLHADE